MENISKYLETNLREAFSRTNYKSHINKINPKIFNVHYSGIKNVDYCFPGCMPISKILNKIMEIKITPEKLAKQILEKSDLDDDMWFIKIDRNRININPTTKYLNLQIYNLLKEHNNTNYPNNDKKILVDFSSPNIAKDMHVGHLRSTIIGDSICRLFESQGYDVKRINHIGDYGLQFGMLIQFLYEKYGIENVNNMDNIDNMNIEISDLQNFYVLSKKKFDGDEEFKKESYQKVVELQHGNKNVVKAWEFIKEISRKSYNQIYERLDINLDEVGESFYQPMIPDLIEELKNKKLLIKEDGRFIIKIPNIEQPLTVIKSDGGYTYDTTDLAAIRYRLVNLQMDKVYYVVDNGQANHFNQIFEVAKMAGWLTNQVVRHIGFGLVIASDGKKFRTRNGDTVKLIDLLDQSLVESKKTLEAKKKIKMEFKKSQKIKCNDNDDNDNDNNCQDKNISEDKLTDDEMELAIKNIAYGSIKYSDLSTIRTNNYKFSFEHMLSFNGNTAPYLIYAYIRVCSIIRKTGDNFDKILSNIDINDIRIEQDEEIKLAIQILRFSEIIENVSSTFLFHILANYLYNISVLFHKFFTNCKCIQFKKNMDGTKSIQKIDNSKILLCEMTKRIMDKCFNILGIKTLQRI